MAYDPPESNNIPFNFTKWGYEAPTDELLFNFKDPLEFGNLQAAVQVMQLHRDAPHVYKTTCPKYVVGYQNGRVQIIKGKCTHHALQDLGAALTVLDYASTTADLKASIDVLQIGVGQQDDLSASVYGIPPRDLPGIIRSWHREITADLNAMLTGTSLSGSGNIGGSVGTHSPGNLGAVARVWASGIGDLPAVLTGDKYHGTGDLPAIMGAHSPGELQGIIGAHVPGDLPGIIKPYNQGYKDLPAILTGQKNKGIQDLIGIAGGHYPGDLIAEIIGQRRPAGNLPASIHSWQEDNLQAIVEGGHYPVDLQGLIDVRQHTNRLLAAQVYGWQAGNLRGLISSVFKSDLPAYLQAIAPVDLPAYLKVWPQSVLPASVRSWGRRDLGATIDQIYDAFLPARITGIYDNVGNLGARLKGYSYENPEDLSAYIKAFHKRDLGGYLRPVYINNLPAYLFAVTPRNLKGIIHAWDVAFLQGIINGINYPWNLTASIASKGYWRLLGARISPVAATAIYETLRASVHPWEMRGLPAMIAGANTVFLSAYINPLGMGANLNASIYPKMIRLTTVINIPTLAHRDLSAIINYPCRRTGYSDLASSLYAKFKGDLIAYIRPLIYNYKPALLGASIGYANTVLEVDKLKLSLTINPGEAFVEDKLRFALRVLKGGLFLGASIRGTLRYRGLSAYVVGDEVPKYTYDRPIKNREVVVHKTYDGIFKQFEYVEMSFRSIVRDYFYSSDGDIAWKKDRFERWMLDIKSYLPADQALNLKRRLHRATVLYDLKKFQTVDDAMKWAIAYVTEYPQSNLGATIYNRGRYTVLPAAINPRYVRSDLSGLSSSINAVGNTIILSTGGQISKI